MKGYPMFMDWRVNNMTILPKQYAYSMQFQLCFLQKWKRLPQNTFGISRDPEQKKTKLEDSYFLISKLTTKLQ